MPNIFSTSILSKLALMDPQDGLAFSAIFNHFLLYTSTGSNSFAAWWAKVLKECWWYLCCVATVFKSDVSTRKKLYKVCRAISLAISFYSDKTKGNNITFIVRWSVRYSLAIATLHGKYPVPAQIMLLNFPLIPSFSNVPGLHSDLIAMAFTVLFRITWNVAKRNIRGPELVLNRANKCVSVQLDVKECDCIKRGKNVVHYMNGGR